MGGVDAYLIAAQSDGLVSTSCQGEACRRFGVTFAEAEAAILTLGLFPSRYQRNRETISNEGQLALLQSCVAVIGCGGLGGYIVEELARLGVGRIVAADPDVFEEHNLNRQLLSRIDNLGEPKVAAAAHRVAEINPAVQLVPHRKALGVENGRELLSGVTVAVDALDNVQSRLELAELCRELAIPLVHGAIAGWYGQVATQLPGDDISIYLASAAGGSKGVESRLGNPSFTPAVVASLQVAEVCKVILGQGEPLSGRMLIGNLLEMEFEEIRL
ncbi:MAG TPA: thiamine biosynthesis protein ThiF [Geobacter sp.]|nr:thiamine biosynthesis protein ThiF [Geobacter sp.]